MGGIPGLIIAAPATASGKTVVTLAALRALAERGVEVASFKTGPDYIDPAFHQAASGRVCYNLDCRAMRQATMAAIASRLADNASLVIGEGVMGLYDGAPDGAGSTAELARLTGWPVVLVVDAARQGASAAAVVHGFATFEADTPIAGVIFNRIAGERHRAMIERAAGTLPAPVLGYLPRHEDFALPERHLGLVQAGEHGALGGFLDRAAGLLAEHVDMAALQALARPLREEFGAAADTSAPLAPLGQRIWVARDEAFGFAYAHVLEAWRGAGAEVTPFSPLGDQAPDADADAVFLPGGYPELHAGRLAANTGFLAGLEAAAARGAAIYGECGGYMVLGNGLTDANGERHQMAGLLALETSFAEPRLQLGYRDVVLAADAAVGPAGAAFRGHEFHYATATREDTARPLFTCRDGGGADLGPAGMVAGNVAGSFIHLIDSA